MRRKHFLHKKKQSFRRLGRKKESDQKRNQVWSFKQNVPVLKRSDCSKSSNIAKYHCTINPRTVKGNEIGQITFTVKTEQRANDFDVQLPPDNPLSKHVNLAKFSRLRRSELGLFVYSKCFWWNITLFWKTILGFSRLDYTSPPLLGKDPHYRDWQFFNLNKNLYLRNPIIDNFPGFS